MMPVHLTIGDVQLRSQTAAIEKIKGFMAESIFGRNFPGIDVPSQAGDGWASSRYYAQYGNTDWFEYYYKDQCHTSFT